MKKLTLLVIVGLCFGVSGFAPITLKADNIKDAYKVFSFFHGKWQQEIEIEGTKTIEHGKCEGSAGGCNIWIGEKGTFISGYDPKTKNGEAWVNWMVEVEWEESHRCQQSHQS